MEIYQLDRETVTRSIARGTIGCYQLGDFTPDGRFRMRYIGRSTTCLQHRLLDHASMSEYGAFGFVKTESVKETHQLECLWFHTHRELLDNVRHPDAPRSLPYTCPFCPRHSDLCKPRVPARRGVA